MSESLRILLIEDSNSDANLMVHLLRKAGFDAQGIRMETPEEYRTALAGQVWDVIICDYLLPGFDAPTALKILKKTGLDIPFIVVSGAIGEDTAVEMMKAGAQDYILKNNLTRLPAAVARELREVKVREERRQAKIAFAHEEYLLRALIDNLPDRIYYKDLQSRFIRISRSQADVFGLADPSEAIGKTDFDFYTEEHARPAYRDEQRIITTGEAIIGIEEKETYPDGHVAWVTTTKMPLYDESSNIIGTFGISNDITAKREAEQSLALRGAALDAAANAIVITDREGTILYTNPAFTQLTGFSQEESIGKNPRIVKSGRQEVAFYRQLWETILVGKVWHGELVNRRKDGSSYNEEMSITPIFSTEGELVYFVAIKQDITRQKMAEQALRDEEKRYRSLYETVPVGIYRSTPDGRFLMANPMLIHLLGYETFDELAQLNMETDVYSRGYSRMDFLQRMETDGWVRGYEVGFNRKNGSIVFLRMNSHVVRDTAGEIQYFEGVLEDITDFRRSEMQNQKLVAAFEQAFETVIISDQDGQIQYMNPAFESLFGLPAKEVAGKNISILANAYQGNKEWQAILDFPRSGKVWRGDVRAEHANGTTLRIDTAISPVFGPERYITGLVFVMRDVTQERIAEARRHQSQKLEAIGQLAAGIAHEINTPTQFIGNNIRFLQKGFHDLMRLIEQYQTAQAGAGNAEMAAEAFQKAESLSNEMDFGFLVTEIPAAIEGSLKGIERVTKIVGAMKEFSHPGAHEKVMTDINHAIENTIIVSRNEWKYNAEMKTDLAPDLPQIPCLVDEFNQVILNLITNAADAIRDARSVHPADEMSVIGIRTSRNEDWVEVRVSDNGSGIPAAIRDRVFDPFFTTKEVGKGTGQGLSISYDVIVNRLGGKITFETEAGKGTTFLLQLPIGQEERQISSKP
jgi:two-component system, NtrC family, sensor kinase